MVAEGREHHVRADRRHHRVVRERHPHVHDALARGARRVDDGVELGLGGGLAGGLLGGGARTDEAAQAVDQQRRVEALLAVGLDCVN